MVLAEWQVRSITVKMLSAEKPSAGIFDRCPHTKAKLVSKSPVGSVKESNGTSGAPRHLMSVWYFVDMIDNPQSLLLLYISIRVLTRRAASRSSTGWTSSEP